MGAEVNANIGRLDELQTSKFHSTLGPYGYSKRNSKGEGLLTVYLTHRLQVMNTFFEGKAKDQGMVRGATTNPPAQAKQNHTCLT